VNISDVVASLEHQKQKLPGTDGAQVRWLDDSPLPHHTGNPRQLRHSCAWSTRQRIPQSWSLMMASDSSSMAWSRTTHIVLTCLILTVHSVTLSHACGGSRASSKVVSKVRNFSSLSTGQKRARIRNVYFFPSA
jgi:hypothetical protein